jgi:acyl carrier protein
MSVERDSIRQRILARIQETFPATKAAELDQDSALAGALGLNSMQVVDLVMSIEDEFAIQVPDRELEKLTTLGACVDFVAASLAARDRS